MNWSAWLQGLIAATLGGAASAGAATVSNRVQNGKNAPPITGTSLGISVGVGALVTGIAYILRSPISSPVPAPTLVQQPETPGFDVQELSQLRQDTATDTAKTPGFGQTASNAKVKKYFVP